MSHPHEQEIRTLSRATPFAPFVIVTGSGARYRVPTLDHLIFAPITDENGRPLPEEERPAAFQLFSRGSSYHWIFFDAVEAIEDLKPMPNGDKG
jgi:hypothetical protein